MFFCYSESEAFGVSTVVHINTLTKLWIICSILLPSKLCYIAELLWVRFKSWNPTNYELIQWVETHWFISPRVDHDRFTWSNELFDNYRLFLYLQEQPVITLFIVSFPGTDSRKSTENTQNVVVIPYISLTNFSVTLSALCTLIKDYIILQNYY